jgi:hypothetical protein
MITNGLIPLLLLMSHKFEERILSTGLGLIMRDDEYLDADERRRAIRLLHYDAAQERNPGLFEGGKVQSFPGCRWISTSLVLGSMRTFAPGAKL